MNQASSAMQKVLDTSPMQSMHWRIWTLTSAGVFLDGADLFVIGIAMPLIIKQWSIGPVLVGALGAAAELGCVLGAALGGFLTDKLGRKAIYLLDLGCFILFSVAAALAWDISSLIVFRFLLGVGIGADYPICASYVAEFMPARIRGRMLIGAFSLQALGMVAAATAGAFILTVYPSDHAWRWMLGMGAIPAFVVLLLRTTVPESARWLLEHGQVKKAASVIGRLVPARRLEVEALALAPPPAIEPPQEKPLGYGALFSPRYLRRTILAGIPWGLMDICTYGVGVFTPIILGALAFSGQGLNTIAQDFKATEGAAFLDIFLVIGFLLNIALVERLGRIRLQLFGFFGMAAGLLILALSSGHVVLVFAGFMLFNVVMNMGPNATTFILPAELFSTRIRASGHGFAAACAKSGAVAGIFFLPLLKDDLGTTGVLIILALVALLGLVITYLFRVETMGRTLEELNP